MRNRFFILSAIILTVFAAGLFTPGAHGEDAKAKVEAVPEPQPDFSPRYRHLIEPGDWGTVVMKRNIKPTDKVSAVVFPHWAHRAKYTCKVCHTDLGFAIKAGGTDIKQNDISNGKYCGACHDAKAAFGPLECARCHSKGLNVPENTGIDKALSGLPKNEFGNQIDWVAAAKDGKITPAASLDGKTKMTVLDTKITIPVTKFTPHPPDVVFPHKAHTEVLDCSTCHPALFKDKKGGNPDMNMMKIIAGQYCGTCHTTVAFPLTDCFRCHSGPIPKIEETEATKAVEKRQEEKKKEEKKKEEKKEEKK